ncbi:MAG: PKD domain-containing protein, partial [Bacteroidia bacterium]|nr:PKD domain-containing protein [Bacteroidia bacterium]
NQDNTYVEYWDGTSWINLTDPPRTSTSCGSGVGIWTARSIPLPPSADNNPSVKIGFRWVNNNGGVGISPSFAVDSIRLTGGLPPVAGFSVSDSVLGVGDCILFSDLSQNAPLAYSWSFIGGTPSTSNDPNPANICYTSPGTYRVQLVVVNASGTDTLVKSNYITVNPCLPPVADFSADSTSVCERSCVNFTDQSLNGATSWVWNFPGGLPATSTSPNPTGICYFTPGSYPVTLIVSNQYGSDTLTLPGYMNINSCPLPVAGFNTSTPDICSNTCISFFDLSTQSPTSWEWFFPGASPDTSSQQNPAGICYPQDGYYDVTLIVHNQYGQDTLTQYSLVHVESVPSATVSQDTSMYFGNSYQLLATGGISYSWSPATGLDTTAGPSPVATPDETTTYTVQITDGSGCTGTRQVTVTILHDNDYFIPNTFSPNKDGHNDYLFVRGNNLYGVRFSVYDRWGEKVFETTDPLTGWDGTYKGKELDPAVFVYVLTINYNDGKTLTKTGNITLVR